MSIQHALMNEEEGDMSGGGATGGGGGGEETSEHSFDMEKVTDQMGAELFGEADHDDADDEVIEAAAPSEKLAPTEKKEEPTFTARPAPQSWAKEKHEVWSKLDAGAQEYIEQREKQMSEGVQTLKEDGNFGRAMKETIAPYQGLIQAQGLDTPTAIKYLLNAHNVLSNSGPAEKVAHLAKIANSYGINLADAGNFAKQTGPRDPMVRQLQEELQQVKGYLSQGQQAAQQARQTQVANEVETFASDAAHPYFDECSDDIVAHINAGHSLQDAYEKAVWANPITRAKEIARVTTQEREIFQKTANEEAKAAKRITSTNLNGRDTRRAPTAPKGTMEDTMRETLSSIKNRTH